VQHAPDLTLIGAVRLKGLAQITVRPRKNSDDATKVSSKKARKPGEIGRSARASKPKNKSSGSA